MNRFLLAGVAIGISQLAGCLEAARGRVVLPFPATLSQSPTPNRT